MDRVAQALYLIRVECKYYWLDHFMAFKNNFIFNQSGM